MRSHLTAYLTPLRRYARLLTRDADRAEDLVQESLVKAIVGARTWNRRRDLRTWLFAILHNTHVSRCRRQRLETDVAEGMRATTPRSIPAGQVERIEVNETIAALMDLPEAQREALVLIAVEGLSYKDAADILGIPIGTLMSRLARGRETLRDPSRRAVEPSDRSPGSASPRKILRLVR